METVSLRAAKRPEAGGAKAKSVRDLGRIPAVVYGGDINENISVEFNDVRSLVYTPDFKLAEIDLEGTKHKCIVKEVQFHPLTDQIQHIDFLRLIDGVPVKVEIPVKFKGVSPGVKEGGSLTQTMRKVKVKTTPENLVNEVFGDISELVLGSSIRVRDLEIDENMEIMSNPSIPVANVEIPRALRSQEMEEEEAAALAAAEAAEGGEGAEGEATEGGDDAGKE